MSDRNLAWGRAAPQPPRLEDARPSPRPPRQRGFAGVAFSRFASVGLIRLMPCAFALIQSEDRDSKFLSRWVRDLG